MGHSLFFPGGKLPVHKTCRQFLVGFVDRLEGDDEIVVDIKFDGQDVWVITELADDRPTVVNNYGLETRGAS